MSGSVRGEGNSEPGKYYRNRIHDPNLSSCGSAAAAIGAAGRESNDQIEIVNDDPKTPGGMASKQIKGDWYIELSYDKRYFLKPIAYINIPNVSGTNIFRPAPNRRGASHREAWAENTS